MEMTENKGYKFVNTGAATVAYGKITNMFTIQDNTSLVNIHLDREEIERLRDALDLLLAPTRVLLRCKNIVLIGIDEADGQSVIEDLTVGKEYFWVIDETEYDEGYIMDDRNRPHYMPCVESPREQDGWATSDYFELISGENN